MKRKYRVFEENGRFYPEWRRGILTLWSWRRFYFTKCSDLDDTLFVRNYMTEEDAWEFIKKKKSGKFSQYDTEN
jgi:hypothetical protein